MKMFTNFLRKTSCRRAGILFAFILATTISNAPAASVGRHQKAVTPQPVRFAVLSDLHLCDPRLITPGPAYEAYLAEDPKLLVESEAILESALKGVVDQHPQFVIISGDLAKDGEVLNHVRVTQHLAKLEHQGIKVYVIPGNHDINNADAVKFLGDSTRPVPTVNPQTFRALYQRFGYGEAIARDPHSLSYLAEPVPGLWLLGIDSCKYEESKELGFPVVSGTIKPETMAWIEGVMHEAEAKGKEVIGFMHHGVNQHFLGEFQLFPDYLVDDWPEVSAHLAGLGLKVIFTGHYHSQDAAYSLDVNGPTDPLLCDVETSSLVTYPCAYRFATLDGTTLAITSQRVTEIDADTGGMPFQQYAFAFLWPRVVNISTVELMTLFGLPEDQASAIAPLVAQAIIANYAGDEQMDAATQAIIDNLLATEPGSPTYMLGMLLTGIWTDLPPGDNQLTVDVSTN